KEDATEEDVIENIDIGGPTMLRAAAKNGKDVIVAVDPDDYDGIIEAVKNGSVDVEMRKKLSAKVFRHTAQYDAMIARYFNQATEEHSRMKKLSPSKKYKIYVMERIRTNRLLFIKMGLIKV